MLLFAFPPLIFPSVHTPSSRWRNVQRYSTPLCGFPTTDCFPVQPSSYLKGSVLHQFHVWTHWQATRFRSEDELILRRHVFGISGAEADNHDEPSDTEDLHTPPPPKRLARRLVCCAISDALCDHP